MLVALVWVCLALSLYEKWFFPVFVALYALSNSALAAVKGSLVLKGLSTSGGSFEDNATARDILMTASRLGILFAAAGLLLVIGLMLVMLPVEYLYARRIALTKEARHPA